MIKTIRPLILKAGVALAVVTLVSAASAQSREESLEVSKSYPPSKAVSGETLANADAAATCCQQAAVQPAERFARLDLENEGYLRRVPALLEPTVSAKRLAKLPAALDRRPGGLAWAGW